MPTVKLTNCDQYALVDQEMLDIVNQYSWYLNQRGYAAYDSKINGRWTLGPFIYYQYYGVRPNFVDHINRNPLDNRIQNLRVATKSENMRNRPKQSNNKSGYKGVHFDRA